MRRFVITLLPILAVFGFMLPPAQFVHAHDDGHDPHAHGAVGAYHAPLCGHSQSNVTQDDDDDHPHDGNVPEHHVHYVAASDVIAPLRGLDSATDRSLDTAIALIPIVGLWSLLPLQCRRPDDVVPQRGRDGPRAYSRTLDHLIWIGSLLI